MLDERPQGNYVHTEPASSTKVHVKAGCARTLLQPLSQCRSGRSTDGSTPSLAAALGELEDGKGRPGGSWMTGIRQGSPWLSAFVGRSTVICS